MSDSDDNAHAARGSDYAAVSMADAGDAGSIRTFPFRNARTVRFPDCDAAAWLADADSRGGARQYARDAYACRVFLD
jgi:hypothetical protein